jgi:hypothetical protein
MLFLCLSNNPYIENSKVVTPKGLNVKSHWWNLGKTYQKCLNPEGVEYKG